jgi:hypothetical protein
VAVVTGSSPKCGGEKRQGGGPCTQPAGWGTPHPGTGRCKLHAGNTASHVKAAQEEQARAAVVTYGLPRDISPTEAILEEVRWTAGHVAWLRGIVQAIDPLALTWGVTKRKAPAADVMDEDGPRDPADIELAALPEVTEEAGVNVWLKLYLEERRHLVDVAATAVRIGIEERRVRLEEEKGALLVVGLQWLFAELGLSTRKLELANRLAIDMLRALAAGQPPGAIAGEVVM